MPLEFYGADLSDPQARADYIDAYSVVESTSEDPDEFEDYDTFANWLDKYPDEYKDFLTCLSQSQEPSVRALAGRRASMFVDTDPEFATSLAELLMDDEDQGVKKETSGQWRDVLTGDYETGFLDSLGLARVARIARAYKKATESLPSTD